MNRREFLKLLGVSTAAAVITPARFVHDDLAGRGRLVTEYDLTPGTPSPSPSTLMVLGFALEAPAGKLCRATLRVRGRSYVYPSAMRTGNGAAEIVISRIERANMPMLALDVDAAGFNLDAVPVDVDWGIASAESPIHIDYRSISGKDETLLLGLWQRVLPAPSNQGGINA